MARQDIAGLLTGISSTQRPNPNASAADWRMQFGQQQAGRLGSAVRGVQSGLLGGAPVATPQEAIQMGLGKLDLGTVEGLSSLARVQQLSGDIAGAAQTAARIKKMQDEIEQQKLKQKQAAAALASREDVADQVRSAGYGKIADAIVSEAGSGNKVALEGGIKLLTNLAQPPKKTILTVQEQLKVFQQEKLFEADVETVSGATTKAGDRFAQYAPIVAQMKELTDEVEFGAGSVPLATVNQTLHSLGSKLGIDVGILDPKADATLTYNSLSKRLKALLLEAQKGAISNLENTEITKNTANPSQTSNQAQALVNFLEASLESDLNRSASQRSWLEQTGSLTGFDAAWKKYTEDFPRTSGFTVDEDPLTKDKTVVANFEPVKENFNLFNQLYLPSKGKDPVFVTKEGKGMTVDKIKKEIINDQLEQMKKASNNPNWKPTNQQRDLVELDARKNIGKLITLRLSNGTYTVTR
jgi:type III secretion system FlhB-like substrate exporter